MTASAATRNWIGAYYAALDANRPDEAMRYFPSDARYLWFLGLARYQQGKSSYHEDFRQAAALEQQGNPNRAEVNAALERIQGPLRAVLARYRQ